ncbi:MAG TPA: YebC/PmpR family DNA-binding transcriptional regulator [Kiritimatiellia bacterium]|nr:YebC/PmpR family DNA-binding transcriptional regulator [Kiritimatiellia bacterium]HMO99588.1 YebC/PmpR family DNA-binding transcriptional regulator [Kiritimatiellia bacterium]
MAGHSKWANIKHRKAASDAVKGKVFSKMAKEIMVAARLGGGDPGGNITLRSLIQKARGVNMPMDNIERAIKKGTGEIAADAMEEVVYEGFAAGGVSLIVSCLTDNRNRTAAEVRHLFSKYNGNLGTQGSVIRNYSRKGQIFVDATSMEEDKLLELALEAGAEDVHPSGEEFEVITDPADFHGVVEKLTQAGVKLGENEITMISALEVQVTDKDQAAQLIKFVSALEELDDVQNVYSNFDIDDALLEQVG